MQRVLILVGGVLLTGGACADAPLGPETDRATSVVATAANGPHLTGNGILVFAGSGEDYFTPTGLWLADPDGSSAKPLLRGARFPSWSPNGKWIAYAAAPTGSWDLYVLNARDGSIRQLTDTDDASETDPDWSPDGRRLVYVEHPVPSAARETRRLMVLDLETGATFPLLETTTRLEGPDWSPNGKRIAYASQRNGCYGVHVIHADGTGDRLLTVDVPCATHPAWSPNGRQIAFAGGDYGRGLWVMDSDGSNPRMLVDFGDAWSPAWSANGAHIAFTGAEMFGTPRTVHVVNTDGTNVRDLGMYAFGLDWSTGGVLR